MFVSVVSLSLHSSREWYLLYVKCLCLLSRYLVPVVENGICYMLNVFECCLVISVQYLLYIKYMCLLSRVPLSQPSSREWHLLYVKCLCVCVCVLSRYLSPVVENGICYMLNVCVCRLVISAQ